MGRFRTDIRHKRYSGRAMGRYLIYMRMCWYNMAQALRLLFIVFICNKLTTINTEMLLYSLFPVRSNLNTQLCIRTVHFTVYMAYLYHNKPGLFGQPSNH